MNKGFINKMQPHGVATRRVYQSGVLKGLLENKYHVNLDACMDSKGIINFDQLCGMAFDLGISKMEFKQLLDKSAKKLFAGNFIWKSLKQYLNIDLVIPFITGYYTTKAIKANLIVNTGHKKYADQVGGTTAAPVTAMAYGTGAVAADAADTALGAEVARGAATVTNETTTTTGDTEQWVKTFTAGGAQAITEEGLFDNNSSGGIMIARQVFAAVNMVLNDTIQFTHKIQS